MAVAEYLVANRKDAGMPGPQGPAGPAGVTSARGETLPPGGEVEVSLENRVLTVKVPRGDKGDTGDAATVTIGDVTTGEPGGEASVANSGDEHDAVLDITLPRGDRGPKGDTATVKVGSVTTGEPGSQASVTNSGTDTDAVWDITIPRGDKGEKGDPGDKGDPGPRGEGLQVDHVADSIGGLPSSGVSEGDTGMVAGELYAWDGSKWVPQGTVQGVKGDPGVTPNITLTASVDANVGTPSVNITKTGTPENPVFDIALHNLKGGVNTVTHDDTLTGDGTSGAPLGTASGSMLNPYGQNAIVDANQQNNGLMLVTYNSINLPIPSGPARGFIISHHGGFNSPRIAQLFVNSSDGTGARIFARGGSGTKFDEWTEFATKQDIPSDYVSDSELASKLAGYVTDGELTQGLQAESAEREKQDGLLEDSINGKIAASNVKAGDGIRVSVSGNDATVSLNARTIPVTFESSLFASGLAVRKTVSGLGSVNMISPAADAGNVAVIQAAGPVLAQDHGDDSSIPEGMVQLTVATAPTADMDFVITVLRSEA